MHDRHTGHLTGEGQATQVVSPVPVLRVEGRDHGVAVPVLGSLPVDAPEQAQVVVSKHGVQPEIADGAPHPDGVRPLGVQVAHQHDAIGSRMVEQPHELFGAAVHIPHNQRAHPPLAPG